MRLRQLNDSLYRHLKSIARRHLRGTPPGQTITPTVLVHEAYLRLAGRVEANDEAHLKALFARKFRQVLVDHARARARRPQGRTVRVTVFENLPADDTDTVDLIALHEALDRLAALNPAHADVLELKHFGGLKLAEIARIKGKTERTIRNWMRFAEAWLRRELSHLGKPGLSGS